MTVSLNKLIILDMTTTKQQQSKCRQDRWNGYKVAVIKDSESALDKLQQVLLTRKIHRNMTHG